MFKAEVAVLAVFWGVAGVASDENRRPDSIQCRAKNKDPHVQSITISKLNTEEPEVDVDGSLDGFKADLYSVTIIHHNGCDNFFQFTFMPDDLNSMAEGKLKKVTGLMSYYHADSTGVVPKTVAIRCTKKR